jgi:hypothetical protein
MNGMNLKMSKAGRQGLIELGMIDSRGHGRGAVWFLGAASKFAGESNKVE